MDTTIAKRGRLLQSDGPLFTNKVFHVVDGTRHWVINGKWLGENGYTWPDDVEKVTDVEIAAFSAGRPRACHWNPINPPADDSVHLREIAVSFIRGYGVEFGAASNPMPFSDECTVEYADVLTYEELTKSLYPGQTVEEMMRPTIKATIENLEPLPDDLDFIAAAHVIEHVPDPIGTIARAARKLRSGGQLLLMVPDMRETFDRYRAQTELEHLVLDFYGQSHERDKTHFQEFYREAFATPEASYEATWRNAWEDRFPIHYHTWTYESFKAMADFILVNVPAYKSYWSYPTRGNEFCFILKKS